DRVSAAYHRVASQGFRRPGEADARLEIADRCISGVVQSAVVVIDRRRAAATEVRTSLARALQLAADRIEIDLTIFDFDPWRLGFVAKAQIKRQRLGSAPVILEIRCEDVRAMPP